MKKILYTLILGSIIWTSSPLNGYSRVATNLDFICGTNIETSGNTFKSASEKSLFFVDCAAATPGTTFSPTAVGNQVCVEFNNTVQMSVTGGVIPDENPNAGFFWYLTSAPPTSTNNPYADPNYLGRFGISETNIYPVNFTNDGSILPNGTYYFTPFVFGNATVDASNNYTFDSGCSFSGTYLEVEFKANGVPCVPLNDDFANAAPITCGDFVTGNNTDASIDYPPGSYSSCGIHSTTISTANNLWYSWVGDGTRITLDMCGSGFNTAIGVFYECPVEGTNLICLGGNDNYDCDGDGSINDDGYTSRFTFNSVIGTQYYFNIHGRSFQTGSFQLQMTCEAACTPPSNQVCSSNACGPAGAPMDIGVIGSTCSPITGDNTCASSTRGTSGSSCTINNGATYTDVWFQFTTGSNKMAEITLTAGTAVDPRFTVHSPNCTSNFIECSSDVAFLTNLAENTTYYINVLTESDNVGSFSLCVKEIQSTISPGTPGSCVTADSPVISTGSGEWLHIRHEGDLVLSIFDSEPLGEITCDFYVHNGDIRRAGYIQYLDRNWDINVQNQPTGSVEVYFYILYSEFLAINAAADGYYGDIYQPQDFAFTHDPDGPCNNVFESTGDEVIKGQFSQYYEYPAAGNYKIPLNVSGFSSFYLHEGFQPLLPVELDAFTATGTEQGNRLEWNTLSETNNSHFEIERSENGTDFETIGRVEGNGNSEEKINYNYFDAHKAALTYYRLKQVDFDGAFAYSDTRVAKQDISKETFSVLPNPVSDQLNIRFLSLGTGEVQLNLMDVNGKIIIEKNVRVNEGEGLETIDASTLPQGVYFLEMRQGEMRRTEKIIKE